MPRFSGTLVEEEQAPRFGGGTLVAQPEQVPEREPEPWYEDLAEGLAVSGMETYYGIKDLVGDLSEEEQATLKDWREDAAQSGWGTAGRVVGELGQLALPGAGVLKAAKAAQAAGRLGKTAGIASTVLGEAGLAGAHGYLKAPSEHETREGEAMQAAAAALAGMGVGKLLKTAAKGIKKTPEAERLLREGVYLPPHLASDSAVLRGLGDAAEVTPFLARGARKARQAAEEDFNAYILKKSVPAKYAGRVTKTGNAGAQQVKSAISDAYDSAWRGVDVPPQSISNARQIANDLLPTLTKKDRPVINRIIKELEEGADARKIDGLLGKEIGLAKNKYYLKEAIEKIRGELRSGVPANKKILLNQADEAYPKYLAAMDAASKAADNSGVFTPKQLIQSARRKGGDIKAAQGIAPLQQEALEGMATVGRQVGGQPLEWFRRLAGATPGIPGMRATGNVLLGETSPQRFVGNRIYDPVADALRGYVSPARLGAAYEE